MTRFTNAREPALTAQDAAMLPAQTSASSSGGANLFMARTAEEEAAFVPARRISAAPSEPAAMTTAARTGAPRNILFPQNDVGFITIAQPPVLNPLPPVSQFGQNIYGVSCTREGSAAGRAIFGACGVCLPSCCSCCGCEKTVGEEVTIDGDNGIKDPEAVSMPLSTGTAPVAAAAANCAAAPSPAAVTYTVPVAAPVTYVVPAPAPVTFAVPVATPVACAVPAAAPASSAEPPAAVPETSKTPVESVPIQTIPVSELAPACAEEESPAVPAQTASVQYVTCNT